eukprot:851974-Rhodomonas_salina.1
MLRVWPLRLSGSLERGREGEGWTLSEWPLESPEAVLCCHGAAVRCVAVSESLALVLSGADDHS